MSDVMILVFRKLGIYIYIVSKVRRRVHCLVLKTGNE